MAASIIWALAVLAWLVIGWLDARAILLSWDRRFPDVERDGSDVAMGILVTVAGPIGLVGTLTFAASELASMLHIHLPKGHGVSARAILKRIWKV